MTRVHVETGAPLEVLTKARIAVQSLLATVLLVPMALLAGCGGLVSRNSTGTNPSPQTQTYTISGTISPTTGGSGATITLSGGTTATATANTSGAYTFTGLANGSYVVTPSSTGYTFSPASQSAAVNGANVTGINFTATPAQARTATASWLASTSVVSGYNVYRGTVSGGPYTKLNGSLITLLTYTDATVQNGQTYFFVTTAVDGSGSESVFSNEVMAVIP
jgi:SdrD B-like domain